MSALETQIGGSHYKRYAIQPFEFALVNGYDAGASYICKHITRHRDKLGREDLLKAHHYVELRQEILSRYNNQHFRPFEPAIPVARYVKANSIPQKEALLLTLLEQWLRYPGEVEHAEKMKRKLLELADNLYPVPPPESA